MSDGVALKRAHRRAIGDEARPSLKAFARELAQKGGGADPRVQAAKGWLARKGGAGARGKARKAVAS